MLKELAELNEQLDQMDENAIREPDLPDGFAGRNDCVFMGTIDDVELRKLVVVTSDAMADLHAMLGDDLFPTTDGGQPIIQGPISLVTSLASLLNGVVRLRFKIADLYRPVVTAGWKVYAIPEQHGCGGCGGCGGSCGGESASGDDSCGGCGGSCDCGEDTGGDASDGGADVSGTDGRPTD